MWQLAQVETTGVAWPSEEEVAREVPIGVDPSEAQRVLESVPFWFHTFALNSEQGIYTPGAARDHGYRLASIPSSFAHGSVLDVGAFDGFYSFLAEKRGAERVLAVDNEQYIHWVNDRWGVALEGGEGFRAIKQLLGSRVEYQRMDAFAVDRLRERFDFIFCFGLLHRVENPLGLLQTLTGRLNEGGQILIETYGVAGDEGAETGALQACAPGEIYPDDRFVYWQFTSGALANLAAHIDHYFHVQATPLVHGHPRIIGVLGQGQASALDLSVEPTE